MDRQRAEEIATSPKMEHVTLNGVPVYIQNVHEQKDLARIYPLNDPENEQEVPLEKLEEHFS